MSENNTRVLVVDDEEGMRLALREVLTRRSIEVDTASNGAEALGLLDAHPYSLVLSDVRMPGMDGMQLLDESREKHPGLPFVMMTAYGAVEDAVEAMKRGARDYLIKPFSFETVDAVVDGILRLSASEPAAPKRTNGSRKKNGMIAQDVSMKRLLAMVDKVADGMATVLIEGESGVGKEVLAREIHQRGRRRDQPFVAVNCAALPEGLLESELFGHEKGSFTGAILARKGKFEQADGGTILLDEISEMPLSLQAKLLRALQEREIEPLGSAKSVSVDIRVIATTNRVLWDWVKAEQFRADLYYRLHVISLVIPPLRDRPGDVMPLARHLLEKHCQRNERPTKRLSEEVERYLRAHPWPGNVRELENFIERAVLLCRSDEITLGSLFLDEPGVVGGSAEGLAGAAPHSMPGVIEDEPMTLDEMEKQMILKALKRVDGNRTRAAKQLGVSVRTIRNKLHQYGLHQRV